MGGPPQTMGYAALKTKIFFSLLCITEEVTFPNTDVAIVG